jgi:hypothetical protein
VHAQSGEGGRLDHHAGEAVYPHGEQVAQPSTTNG